MRSDQKDYQMLAEAYTTVQGREQLDEVLGFGTGGIGDKLVSKAGMLAPNKAGKAGARIQTQQFVKQHIMPVFSQLTQQLGDNDQVDAGQVMDIIGNAYGVDPDQIKTFSKFQPGQAVKVKDARNMLFPAAGEAAGIKASGRYAANSGAAGGYTPMQGGGQTVAGGGQPVAGGGQPVAGGGQIKNPRGNGVAPAGGETEVQSGSENPSVLKKIGSGVGNLIGGFAGGIAGGTKKSFDYVNNMGKEDLAKSNSGNSGGSNQQQQSDQQQQQQSDQQQQQQSDQQQQQQGGQERADPKDLPTMDDLAKIPGESDKTPGEDVEEVEAEPITPGTTEPSVGDNITQTNVIDAGDQQQQAQVDQKGEIEPTVITPPAPKSEDQSEISGALNNFGNAVAAGAEDKISEYVTRIKNGEDVNVVTNGLPPAMKAEVEKRASQSQLPLKEYNTPLGGVGFMSKRWGNF
jgi:hypothetical protein